MSLDSPRASLRSPGGLRAEGYDGDVSIVGVLPAAGYATRLQPLPMSKEVYPIGGRPIIDYVIERMRIAGCTEVRVVTRPEKRDVISHVEELGAVVIKGYPETVSASFATGMRGLAGDDLVLIGWPDTLWEPEWGYRPLIEAIEAGREVALGLFEIDPVDLPRSDVVTFDPETGRIERIDVKPARPASSWVWGCAAARAELLFELERAEWPGAYFELLCREGADVVGVPLSDVWLDVGTPESLRKALEKLPVNGGRDEISGD
jgi:glucose-1-phosphate thymidylyltransferase